MRQEVRVARRYAKALVDVLSDERLKEVLGEVKTLSSFVDEKVVRYFKSPAVPVEKKRALLGEILEKVGVCKELSKVLLLMADKDRLGVLKEFASEFERLANERFGVLKAEITTAVETDEETLSRIKEKVEKLLGAKVEVSVKLDPSIIGGFVVKVADKVIDASVKTQLENLKRAISD